MSADGFARIVPRLRTLPESSLLARHERLLVALTALVVAVTRVLAVSRSMWDWDEALFVVAIRDYDVAAHQPHPPGFPLFVAAGKCLALVLDPFRAYQTLNFVAACALFPLVYLIGRELGLARSAAYGAALIYVFLPNVWFYGGTGFSDITGSALLYCALFLLLRGRRDPRSFVAGAVVLGLAAGVRSQALLIACVPALVATWHQWRISWRRTIATIALGGAVMLTCYAGAAFASTSIDSYLATSAALKDYLRQVDSFLSPDRPPLRILWPFYFVHPMRGGTAGTILASLAAAGLLLGLVRRNRPVILIAATFVPFVFFAWLMLDFHSIARYSVAYVVVFALLAAQLPALVPKFPSRFVGAVTIALALLLAGRFIWWTTPALTVARTTVAPPEAAMQWIERDRTERAIFVHGSMEAFIKARVPDRPAVHVDTMSTFERAMVNPDSLFLVEDTTIALHAQKFRRPRTRLWELVRQRYFDVAVIPATEAVLFEEGWHEAESDDTGGWRWMGPRATVRLPAIESASELTLRFEVPGDGTRDTANVRMAIDGEEVRSFVCARACEQRIVVPTRGKVARTVEISTDWWINPSARGMYPDGRDLGLRLMAIGWVPQR
jgi:hypothetical protein